jgi:MFS transporter, ACS family, D-galactonate transporter
MSLKKLYPWIVVGLLWMVGLLNYLDRQMLATMRPAMQSSIPSLRSAESFGYLMGIFLWIYGFMSPVAGLIADRFNKKWLIVGSLFVWSGVTFAMGYATSYDQLYWLRAIMGISEALYLPTALALIADFHGNKTRSLAIGIHMTGLYVGTALGGFGATLAAAHSWQLTFHSFGIAGIVYALVLVAFLKGKNEATEPDATGSLTKPDASVLKSLRVLFSSLFFWIILLYFAISSLPSWATKNWLPTLFAQNLHMPMSKAGPMATITISVSQFLGVIGGGILSDRWVRKNLRGRIYTSAIGLTLMIPALLFLGFGHTIFDFLAAGFCFGIGFGMFDANNMPILCQFVSSKYRASAYGIMNMLGVYFGAFITDSLGKITDEGNLGKGFASLAIVVALAVVLQLVFLRPKQNDFREVA